MNVLNIDSPYAEEICERVLTPTALEDLQRAVQVLRDALPAVREAMDLVHPVQEAHQAVVCDLFDRGVKDTDDGYEALYERTAYGAAIDLTFEILDEVKRVAY